MLNDKIMIQNIKEIYKITDEQFLYQCEEDVYKLFLEHFYFISNKKILFLFDRTFNLKYGALLNHIKGTNNYVYVDKNETHFYENETQQLIPYKKNKIAFDYLITTCALYDIAGNFLVDKVTYKKMSMINAKKVIVITLNMQLVNQITDIKKLQGTIISNNKIIKPPKTNY